LKGIAKISGTVVAAVMKPILSVAALVEEKIVAPINNKITTVALDIAIGQFCALAPNMMKPFGWKTSNAKDVCITAAKEELKKGFDPDWKYVAPV
jgi:hypothetical protein